MVWELSEDVFVTKEKDIFGLAYWIGQTNSETGMSVTGSLLDRLAGQEDGYQQSITTSFEHAHQNS